MASSESASSWGNSFGTAGTLTTDERLAALSIENGAELWSPDSDFASSAGVPWRHPLTEE